MRTIFVNLPVSDIDAATAFYAGLGLEQDLRFSDDSTASFALAENIVAMVMTREKFAGFLPAGATAGDPEQQVSVMNAFSAASREECDDLLAKAVAHGGRQFGEPVDHGFMYGTSFTDPSGNVWEAAWLDPSALES
ncbi:VOC family protein [Klenkia sp. LSe6-5]|uniref:VOC family protein n=1 Tax=Klenkia sesuvii TaxID=3103137 RepID=A0ABU8DY40_9ACTN